MRNRIPTLVAAGLGALIAQSAAAVPLLEIEGGNDATLPGEGVHDVAATANRDGWYNANVRATSDAAITFTYLGKEAGWTNALSTSGGTSIFNTGTSDVDDEFDAGVTNGGDWVDFVLGVESGAGNVGAEYDVTNGLNRAASGVYGEDDYGIPNFWLGYADESQSSVYVGFDDGGGGGATGDDNHDDLVFRIDAISVPEPGPLSLLGFGLVAMGFAARRGRAGARA